MLSCSAIDLAEIRLFSKISFWLWSIISGVVTVFISSRTRRITGERISTFKLGHPVLGGGIRWCMFPQCYHPEIFMYTQAFRDHFVESFSMSKSSWMMDPTHSREMPSCSAIVLAEIWLSSNISCWIWSIISEVVTVLGRPGKAHPSWKNHHVKPGHPVFDAAIRCCMFL